MNKILLLLLALGWYRAGSQSVLNLPALSAPGEMENSAYQKIATDSLSTAFVFWIRGGVQHHFHANHTENIYVIEGEGRMEMADSSFTVKAGDFIQIPKGTVHALFVTIPMKLLSIQCPEWIIDDRVFIEPTRKPHNE